MSTLPTEYLEGIELFNQEKYFEAHEIWEGVWLRSSDPTRIFYQALIQSAGALLHLRNGNRKGALSLFEASLDKFSRVPQEFLGLQVQEFSRRLFILLTDLRGLRPNQPVRLHPEKIPRIAVTVAR